MSMKSAMHFARELVDYTTADVYDIWQDMGIVTKGKFGGWIVTELGHKLGGRYSSGKHHVPIFDFEKTFAMMVDFYQKHKGAG